MDNLLLVDVGESSHYLLQVVLYLNLADAFALLQHFVEGLVAAEFQHHVDVLGVLEDMVEGYHVAVLE